MGRRRMWRSPALRAAAGTAVPGSARAVAGAGGSVVQAAPAGTAAPVARASAVSVASVAPGPAVAATAVSDLAVVAPDPALVAPDPALVAPDPGVVGLVAPDPAAAATVVGAPAAAERARGPERAPARGWAEPGASAARVVGPAAAAPPVPAGVPVPVARPAGVRPNGRSAMAKRRPISRHSRAAPPRKRRGRAATRSTVRTVARERRSPSAAVRRWSSYGPSARLLAIRTPCAVWLIDPAPGRGRGTSGLRRAATAATPRLRRRSVRRGWRRSRGRRRSDPPPVRTSAAPGSGAAGWACSIPAGRPGRLG
jgi:hypothetical protein